MTLTTPVAVEFHSVHIFYNTPNLLTGVQIWAPDTIGEAILNTGFTSVIQVWNGSTPRLHIFAQGDNPISAALDASPIDLQIGDAATGTHADSFASSPFPTQSIVMNDTTTVMINVDDGAGGSPGATQGEAFIVLAIATAHLPGVSRSSSSPIQS